MGRLSSEATGARHLEIGDTRLINVKDKDGAIVETITLYRTARAYIEDLRDAYNSRKYGNSACEWIIDASGGLRLQALQAPKRLTEAMETRNEAERQTWIHRHRFPERYV